MTNQPDTAWVVDARAIDMAEWKRVVASAVGVEPMPDVTLVHDGGANMITGYRLYYMLQFAKRAGLRRLALRTDGVFWIDEATDWLIESQVDEIDVRVPGGQPEPPLASRIRDLSTRAPRIMVRPS